MAVPWLAWLVYALVLAALCVGAVVLAPRTVELAAQDGDATRFLYGTGGLEQNETQAFRWTARDWGVALFGQPFVAPTLVTLRASATRPATEPLARLRLVGSPEGGAFDVARASRVYHLLARPTTDGGGRQRITFTGSVWTPEGGDGRALGIALSRIGFQQLGGAPLLPLGERGLFFALVALAVAIGLRQLGMPRGGAFAVGLVAALVLAALHWRNAQTLGFLLPNVWWMAAGVAAMLVIAEVRSQKSKARIGLPFAVEPRFVGFGLAILGTITLWFRVLPLWLGLVLALGGALVVALEPAVRNQQRDTETQRHADSEQRANAPTLQRSSAPTLQRCILHPLFVILCTALFLRLFRLNDQPMALWRDEVYHAELAQQIWNNPAFRPVYVPEVDLPALLFYLIAPPIGMFGADLWTLRVVPALAGALTPLALWFAVQPIFGQRVAIVAAWCMAVAAWSLYMSRWTFPVIFDPLFTLLAIGCLWRGLHGSSKFSVQNSEVGTQRSSCMIWAAAGGFFAGLVVYTYHTGRIEPLAIGMFALVRVAANATGSRAKAMLQSLAAVRWPLVVAVIVFGITVAPLAQFALANPQAFTKRLDAVSIFSSLDAAPVAPLAVLADQLGRHALMWNVRGDQNARHFAPFRPMLDPFSGALWLVGLAVCLLWRRGITTTALLVWLGIGLVPGIFSDVAPHAMRTIGALAPACVLVAVGFEALLVRAFRFRKLLAVGLLAGVLAWNAALYFGVTNDLREYYYAFETQRSLLARAARTVANEHPDVRVYLPETLREGKAGQATTLLLNGAPVRWVNNQQIALKAGMNAIMLLPGDLDAAQLAAITQPPGAKLLRTGPPIPFQNKPIYLIYGTGPNVQTIADQLVLP